MAIKKTSSVAKNIEGKLLFKTTKVWITIDCNCISCHIIAKPLINSLWKIRNANTSTSLCKRQNPALSHLSLSLSLSLSLFLSLSLSWQDFGQSMHWLTWFPTPKLQKRSSTTKAPILIDCGLHLIPPHNLFALELPNIVCALFQHDKSVYILQ